MEEAEGGWWGEALGAASEATASMEAAREKNKARQRGGQGEGLPRPAAGPGGHGETGSLPRGHGASPAPDGRRAGSSCGFSCEKKSGNSEFLRVKV